MKRLILMASLVVATVISCGTVQSIIQNTVPYTTQFLVPSGKQASQEYDHISSASSFAQYVGAGTDMVKDIRITSVKVSTSGAKAVDMGMFKSIKVLLSGNNTDEVLIAERKDIGNNIGNTINLDPDTSKVLDEVVKTGSVKARVVYVLKNNVSNDAHFSITMNFTSTPIKK